MSTWKIAIDNLDIIIPAYKALNKIIRTIYSFDPDYRHNFTIIVDGDKETDYESLHGLFDNFHNIDIYYLDENCGPGMARNAGLKIAAKELIMFIDAGDTIRDILEFQYYLTNMWEHTNYYIGSAAHQEEYEGYYRSIFPTHNRMHGKLYRTQFLKNNGIIFNPKYPRANEDIGFNMSARMIAEEFSKRDGIDHIYHTDDLIVCWRNDSDSLTRENNCAYYYKENNMGLAQNCHFAIKIAQRVGVRREIIENTIYEVIPSFYVFYFSSINCYPQYAEEQYLGAIYFYLNEIQKINLDIDKLLNYYNEEMRSIYNDSWHPFRIKFISTSFITWLEELKENSKLEKYSYLLE